MKHEPLVIFMLAFFMVTAVSYGKGDEMKQCESQATGIEKSIAEPFYVQKTGQELLTAAYERGTEEEPEAAADEEELNHEWEEEPQDAADEEELNHEWEEEPQDATDEEGLNHEWEDEPPEPTDEEGLNHEWEEETQDPNDEEELDNELE